jgi:hypothetical protein
MVATSAVVKLFAVSQGGRINRRACDSLRDSDGLRVQHFPHGGPPNELWDRPFGRIPTAWRLSRPYSKG